MLNRFCGQLLPCSAGFTQVSFVDFYISKYRPYCQFRGSFQNSISCAKEFWAMTSADTPVSVSVMLYEPILIS